MSLKKLLATTIVVGTLSVPILTTDLNAATIGTPITTCRDLESIGKGENYPGATHTDAWSTNSDYYLANDIDCSETNPNNGTFKEEYGYDGFDSISMTGTFDGNNKTVSDLYSNRPANKTGGFISRLFYGTLKNINFENIDIAGYENIGLVSDAQHSTLSNITVEGKIKSTAYGEDDFIGGLVGYAEEINISNVATDVDITSTGGLVGGIVGLVWDSNIQSVYTNGDIIGRPIVAAGIAGQNNSTTINNAYSTGTLEGLEAVGLAVNDKTGVVKNSFTTASLKGLEVDYSTVRNLGSEPNGSTNIKYYEGICNGCINAPNSSSFPYTDVYNQSFYNELGLLNTLTFEQGKYPYLPGYPESAKETFKPYNYTNSQVRYSMGEVVLARDGKLYKAKNSTNGGEVNAPETNPTWDLVNKDPNAGENFVLGTPYPAGTRVRYEGHTYESRYWNNDVVPNYNDALNASATGYAWQLIR